MTPGCGIPIDEQLRSIGDLEDGWFDGAGSPYTADYLSRSGQFLHALVDGHLPNPWIYPCASSGGLTVEWDVVSIDVDPSFDTARLWGADRWFAFGEVADLRKSIRSAITEAQEATHPPMGRQP